MVKGYIPPDLERKIEQLLKEYRIDKATGQQVEGYIAYLSRNGYDVANYKAEYHNIMENKNVTSK